MSDPRDPPDIRRLKNAIRRMLAGLDHSPLIDPVEIANMVLPRLDPLDRDLAAHLQIRQILRGILRRDADLSSEESARRKREPIFPGFPLIQRRYGRADHKGYVPVERMTQEDWEMNVARLRGKGGKLQQHADQLEAWGKGRFGEREAADVG